VSGAVAAGVAAATGRAVAALRPVGGGDINDAYAVAFADGGHAFVKTRPDAAPGEYATEAAGLAWLAAADGAPRVPRVLAVRDPGDTGEGEEAGERTGAGEGGGAGGTDAGCRLLVLEWIGEGRLGGAGEEALGRGLASLHAAGAPAFGALAPDARPPLRIGPLELPADTHESWAALYAEQRLTPLVRPARERGALSAQGARAVEAVCARMGELAGPAEAPARLHGDLWSGNVMADAQGSPVLIDPAAHGGHREVDLAMLALFGGPRPRVLAAYHEALPLAAGHDERVELWQLFPLLVHAVLFGGSYGSAVETIARRLAG
jgi:fructosamine-3-kinase